MWKNVIFAIMLFCLPSNALADIINVDGLTPKQKAELQVQVETLKAASPAVDTKKIDEYAVLGVNVGKALAGTARELGVEINKFAETPVGKLAIVLIVWKLFGAMMVHIMFGVLLALILIPTWIYLFKRLCVYKVINTKVTGPDKENIGKQYVMYGSEADNRRFIMMMAGAVIIGIICFVSFAGW